MKSFIGVLVLCGIYSSHSASVGFSDSSVCANQDDGAFVPVIGDCSLFYMCLNGETIQSTCGSNLHFDPVGKQCIDISRSLCVSGKKTKPASLKPETKQELEEEKPQLASLKPETKPQSEKVKLQKIQSKPQQAELKPETKLEPEEVKPKETQSKPQQAELKPEAKPKPEDVKLQEPQSKPQKAELKPETKPQPEEVQPKESKPQQAELKPETKPKPEEVKSQEPQSKPQKAELKPESEPQPEEVKVKESKPQQTEQKPETKQLEPESQKAVTSEEFCTGKAIGSFIPSKINCNEYYVCLGSRIVLKTCPTGLHFNPDVRSCTIPSLANCIAEVESNIQTGIAEEKPQEGEGNQDTSAISSTKGVCIGKANGAMFPMPGSCSGYFACLQESTYELSCGLRHFDPSSRACIQAEESKCVEGEVESSIYVAVETKDSFVGDTYMGSNNSGVAVSNANVQIANTGSVSNVNLVSSSSDVAVGNTDLGYSNTYEVSSSSGQNKLVEVTASSDNAASSNGVQLKNASIGDTDLGQNNSGITIGNANLNINNTGIVKNTNVVLASQNVAVGNIDLGSLNNYDVSGGNLVVNNKTIPIKQTGLPVNKKQISQIDKMDIDVSSSGVVINSAGVKDISIGDTNLGQGNKGLTIGNANINISNSGSVSDVNIISGSQNAAAGNENLGTNNKVTVDGASIPDVIQKENKEVVIAVVDEKNTRMCAGVPSGTLFPRIGDCTKFLTCENGVAFVAVCPHGLHFNALTKFCDWPELAGCV